MGTGAETVIHRRVAEAAAGTNPMVIGRLRSGWAVVGDPQVLPGYSLLLPDPVVADLNALGGAERSRFLLDMVGLGDALLAVTGARRINYEILGNLEPALHAHCFPRYETEPAELGRSPVWLYDWTQAPKFDPDAAAPLIAAVRAELKARDLLR